MSAKAPAAAGGVDVPKEPRCQHCGETRSVERLVTDRHGTSIYFCSTCGKTFAWKEPA